MIYLKNMFLFFINIKMLVIVVFAALAGEGFSIIGIADDHPAVSSILAGVIVTLIVKYFTAWLDARGKAIKTGDKILELEHKRQERIEQQQQELMDDKEAYWKLQNDRLRVEGFERDNRYRSNIKEARQINHAAVNQLMTQQNIILGLQRKLFLAGVDVPEISMLELTKFMLPIWEDERLQLEGETDEQHRSKEPIKKPDQ